MFVLCKQTEMMIYDVNHVNDDWKRRTVQNEFQSRKKPNYCLGRRAEDNGHKPVYSIVSSKRSSNLDISSERHSCGELNTLRDLESEVPV